MADRTLGQQLASLAAETTFESLPRDVVASVKQRVLDVVGLCLAARPLPTSQAVLAFIAEQGGAGRAGIVGQAERVPAPLAALANGVFAHSLDFDDTHLPSVLHPSAPVVPAALAAAELSGASGRETVVAIAVGLEVCVRLGMAGYDRKAGNSVFFEHGQHATSICGAMGGAVAAARLLGLDASGILDALGITASMAAGVIEANRTGGTVKRTHCGWAANSAVTAASLSKHGITGPPTVLEGRFGFFQAFLRGEFDAGEITRGLGTEWAAPGIFFKPYPANHFTHTALDAGRALRKRGLAVDAIESVTLGVPSAVVRTIGQPIEKKRVPETAYEAQFSGPYAVATGLLGGRPLAFDGLAFDQRDWTADLATDPARRSLMALVDVVGDPRCDEIFPNQFPAVLTVRTRDGREWTEEVLTNLGGPRRPLTDAQLSGKFRANAAAVLTDEAAARVEEEAHRLDEAADVRTLLSLTVPSVSTGEAS